MVNVILLAAGDDRCMRFLCYNKSNRRFLSILTPFVTLSRPVEDCLSLVPFISKLALTSTSYLNKVLYARNNPNNEHTKKKHHDKIKIADK